MTEEELREQVRERVSEEMLPTLEGMAARQAAEDALSDDEWYSQRIEHLSKHSSLMEAIPTSKEDMLEHRHQMMAVRKNQDMSDMLISRRVDEVFPEIIRARNASGEDGPLSQSEYWDASMRATVGRVEKMSEIFAERVNSIEDPRRRLIAQKFADMIQCDLPRLRSLGEPGITNESIQSFADQSVAQLNDLTAFMKNTRTLYRPVGQAELDLIEKSGWKEFPPRLPIQPIFYPVLNLEYARKIARDWNTNDAASGFVGYVTAFEVQADFLDRYDIQTVGGSIHREYWIPAEDLAAFNAAIVGPIRVVETFKEGAF